MARKTWIEKFRVEKQPEIKRTDKAFADIPEKSLMLIATPRLVDAYIREIPPGTFVDTATIRKDLALAHGAEYTCPVTTGIFLRIVAEATYEELLAGKSLEDVTPFWRAVAPGSPTAKKLTFGQELIIQQREKEQQETN
ncbi:MAG: hypothetical protein JJU34_06750 [Lunatimonas sp.]|uniref:hypothetical protein n=1 Tax=Lunatimonas sp. TaxID=2060141 RepID=UPI00263BB463|nr:hypothetical protein [Lunatimonas sp.]MCC5936962.1 hypothetical protein [Lunatimonas sp.]